MPLDGRATPEGSRRFRDRAVRERSLPADHFREAPHDLLLSSLGLGTYIGAPDGPTDLAVEQAVTICLTSTRVNVLDTAINYRHQRAERSVGRALARATVRGDVARDEVFVATKNGYLAPDGESKLSPEEWVRDELIEKGVLRPDEVVDGCHAMTPRFLEDQLERSLANLGVGTIDLLYLHNAAEAHLPTTSPDAFLERLEGAFGLYERLRDRGRIGAYGLATWDSLRVGPRDGGFLALQSAVRVAEKIGGASHGLRFVQFPFNLAMPEAATVSNQPVNGARVPLFEAARRLGVACFTSVPLFQGQLARNGPRRPGLSPAQTALQFARSAPGNLAALIGQKTAEHLAENLELASRSPWDPAAFASLLH
jgi:aryl-alcohol dehydrogenase-like predicted oxidoreductase